MVEKGSGAAFATQDSPDRGWVFCPDFLGDRPTEISPPDWSTRIFLFGPRRLPDGPGPDVRQEETEPIPPLKPKSTAKPKAVAEPIAIMDQGGDGGASEKPEAPRPVSS